jgi:predicted RNA-binding Zn ribbon-like protein
VVIKTRFKFIAGALCLDFVNTVGGRAGSDPKDAFRYRVLSDKLAAFEDLVQWSESAGVLSRVEAQKMARCSASRPIDAQSAFHRAVALREAFYRICKSLLEAAPPTAADAAVLNRELANAHAHKRLNFRDAGFAWSWDQPGSFDRILWNVVDSGAAFLASPALPSLRQCPGSDCGWLFVDESRNGSRHWCEMRICGNRAKLRRFRERMTKSGHSVR